MTFVQNLEQDVEHVRVSFLDFVEQHHRVRVPTHALGELTTLLVAHVARRSTRQTRHAELLHEFGHVDPDQRVVVLEQVAGHFLGELRFAHTRWPEENERADRPVWIFQSRASSLDCARDQVNDLVLPDDPLLELLLHFEELLGLGLRHALHRDAGHHRDHFGHVLFIHCGHDLVLGLFPALLGLFQFPVQLLFAVAQDGRPLEFLRLDHRLFLAANFLDLLFQLGDLLRHPDVGQMNPRARLVHHVDGLVGQVAVRDVTIGETHGLTQCRVRVLHPVVGLVARLQPLQNLVGLLRRRRIHHHLLEATLKRAVLLDVLPVLVQRRGPDALQLTARQSWLEHVRGVERAGRAARANDRV